METQANEYNIERPRHGFKKILSLILGLVLLAVVILAVYYFTKINSSATAESHSTEFNVSKGSSSKQIAQKLDEQNLISNDWVFLVYLTLHGANGKIEAGQYLLDSNMPMTQVVEILTRGLVVSSEKSLTTLEGWTNKQIADYLVKENLISQASDLDKILASAQFDFKYNDVVKGFNYEGFLFPDTYRLGRDEGADVLVQKMLKNFESKFTDKMFADMQASGKNMKDVIILASIIEKEIGRNKPSITDEDLVTMQKERELAASVFYNRLNIGMALESDATVNYVVGKTGGVPTLADVRTKSAYNTYLQRGLPPGPISNPGIGSIMAAIYPAQSDYLYFINKADGEAVFAKTLAEHNANIAKYLR